MQYEPYYKIGLPSPIRFRSQIIFGVLLFLFLSFSVSGVYAGIKTGRFEEVFITPVADFVKALENQPANLSKEVEFPSFDATSSSGINVEINSEESNYQTPSDNSDNVIYVYPTIAYKSYEEINKEQDEWWAKAQEQNRQLSEQSKREFEEFRTNSLKRMEEFKKQGELDSLEFKKNAEQWQQESLEEFKLKYGIQ